MDTLEDTGREIIADSNEDPQVVRDVRGELNKIVAPVDVILRKLAERQVKLQNALLRSQEFQVSLCTCTGLNSVFQNWEKLFQD